MSRQLRSTLSLLLLLVPPMACKSDPDEPEMCPMGATSGPECEEVATSLEPIPSCAEPEFDTAGPPVTPTRYRCEGRAGGSIAYQQVVVTVAGTDRGGPGVVQTDPPVTEFPTDGNEVSACCHGLDPAQNPADEEELRDNACQRDCGRAACNRILDSLRDAAAAEDASDGECDAIPAGPLRNGCQDRVRASLEAWISEIETKYDECVAKAIANSDPNLAYDDASIEFHEDRRVVLENDCNTDVVGCLYGAELRPFCQIDDFSDAGVCDQAGNLIDPEATGDGGVVDDTGEPVDPPFGEIGNLVYCDPQTTCLIESELIENVGYNFHVFWEEDVVLTLGTFGPSGTTVTGLQITGLSTGDHAKALLDAFGIINNDVITHVNSTALDSWSNVMDVVADIDNSSYWAVTVRRWRCPFTCSWGTFNYDIARAVSLEGGGKDAEGDPANLGSANGVGNDSDQSAGDGRGCACSQGDTPKNPALILFATIGLGLLLRRRYEAVA